MKKTATRTKESTTTRMAFGSAFSLDCSHCARLRQPRIRARRALLSGRRSSIQGGTVETRFKDIGMLLGVTLILAAAARGVPISARARSAFRDGAPPVRRGVEGGPLEVQEVPSSAAVNNSAITANRRARSAAAALPSRQSRFVRTSSYMLAVGSTRLRRA